MCRNFNDTKISSNEMKMKIITSPFLFKCFMRKLKPIFGLDCETTSLNWLDLELLGFSICDGTRACYIDFTNKYAKRDMKQFLSILQYYINESQLIFFCNAAFDIMVFKKYGVEI